MNTIIGGLIAIAGTLVGAIITGVFNFLNAKSQSVRESKKLRTAKLEELYQLIIEYQQAVGKYVHDVFSEPDKDRTMKEFEEVAKTLNDPTPKLLAMINFYAPEISDLSDNLTDRVDEILKLGRYIFTNSRKNLEMSKVKEFESHLLNFTQECADILKGIASIANNELIVIKFPR